MLLSVIVIFGKDVFRERESSGFLVLALLICFILRRGHLTSHEAKSWDEFRALLNLLLRRDKRRVLLRPWNRVFCQNVNALVFSLVCLPEDGQEIFHFTCRWIKHSSGQTDYFQVFKLVLKQELKRFSIRVQALLWKQALKLVYNNVWIAEEAKEFSFLHHTHTLYCGEAYIV